MRISDKAIWRTLIVLIGVLILIVYFNTDSEKKYEPTDHDAYIMTCRLVRNSLKAPATADFADYTDSKVISYGKTWTVTSYVDAQNSFGALIRTNFVAEVEYVGEKEWKIKSLDTK